MTDDFKEISEGVFRSEEQLRTRMRVVESESKPQDLATPLESGGAGKKNIVKSCGDKQKGEKQR